LTVDRRGAAEEELWKSSCRGTVDSGGLPLQRNHRPKPTLPTDAEPKSTPSLGNCLAKTPVSEIFPELKVVANHLKNTLATWSWFLAPSEVAADPNTLKKLQSLTQTSQ
jgi:hypothetical protein